MQWRRKEPGEQEAVGHPGVHHGYLRKREISPPTLDGSGGGMTQHFRRNSGTHCRAREGGAQGAEGAQVKRGRHGLSSPFPGVPFSGGAPCLWPVRGCHPPPVLCRGPEGCSPPHCGQDVAARPERESEREREREGERERERACRGRRQENPVSRTRRPRPFGAD